MEDCEAVFLKVPQNKVALLNSSVEFQCRTNSSESLNWSFASAGTTDSLALSTGKKLTKVGKSKYRINTNIGGQYDLIIDSVDFSYAGWYKGSEGGSVGSQVEAELAVIGKLYEHPLSVDWFCAYILNIFLYLPICVDVSIYITPFRILETSQKYCNK